MWPLHSPNERDCLEDLLCGRITLRAQVPRRRPRARPARAHRARAGGCAPGQPRHGGRRAQSAGEDPDADHRRRHGPLRQPRDLRIPRRPGRRPSRPARRAVHAGACWSTSRSPTASWTRQCWRGTRRSCDRNRCAGTTGPTGQLAKVGSGLDALEARAAGFGERVDLGTIAFACALGYLDYRFSSMRWRDGRPATAAWFQTFAARESMVATQPPAA